MPRMVLTHQVVDIERWLKGKEERAAALDACLQVAEQLQAAGQGKEALQIYAWLDEQDISPSVENAVLRGLVRRFCLDPAPG